MFGFKFVEEYERYWGARAIYEPKRDYLIDLLPDRQSSENVNDDEMSSLFMRWVNKAALPWLRAEVKRIGLAGNSDQIVSRREGLLEVQASPRKSCGYLYIGCVEHSVLAWAKHVEPELFEQMEANDTLVSELHAGKITTPDEFAKRAEELSDNRPGGR